MPTFEIAKNYEKGRLCEMCKKEIPLYAKHIKCIGYKKKVSRYCRLCGNPLMEKSNKEKWRGIRHSDEKINFRGGQ